MKKFIIFILLILNIIVSCGKNETDVRTRASIKTNPVKIIESNAQKVWPVEIIGRYQNQTKNKKEWFIIKENKKFELIKMGLKNGKIIKANSALVRGDWVVLKKAGQSVLLLKTVKQRRYMRIIKQGGYRTLQSYENKKQIYYPISNGNS